MPTHTCAEMKWVAGMMHLRGLCTTVDTVLQAVRAGDRYLLSDAVFGQANDVYEYDEAYYHEDVARDIRKTKRLFAYGADRVTRVRRGCPSLKEHFTQTPDGGYIDICVTTHNTLDQVIQCGQEMGLAVRSGDALKASIQIGERAFQILKARETQMLAYFKTHYGYDERILKVHGVKTRIWDDEFREGVEWLLTKIGNDASRLPTIMCGGLASRLHEPSFRDGVEWLLTKIDNDASRLPTIMCDGLAKRLDEPSFRDGVDCLLKRGFSIKKMTTLLADDSITAKLDCILQNVLSIGPTISRKRARELTKAHST